MNPFRDDAELAAELRALRPSPRPTFAAELDEKAAAGFPRSSWLDGSALAGVGERLRSFSPRRLVLTGGATALAALAVATAVVVNTEPGDSGIRPGQSGVRYSAPAPEIDLYQRGFFNLRPGGEAAKGDGAIPEYVNAEPTAAPGPVAAGAANRDIERSAQIVLGADVADVAEDAAEVFDAVHASKGIVLRSSTAEGPAGRAGAEFELLIPSANLSGALADLSAIDEVRSRREATADITAPTVAVEERVQDSRARIDSLLAQLAAAETESEREAVEAELRTERRHVAFLRTRLARLDRRANFSHVSVRIETGAGSAPSEEGGGTWGIGDALDDAGHILTVSAAVILVSLAVLGPILLIALLAWLTQRAWIRRGRERALS
jgi:hypothetical protein